MSAKLGRYIFRKIGGRIVPIRVGVEAKTIAAGVSGFSKNIMKKAKMLFSSGFKIGSTGRLLKVAESDGTKSMLKFMDKTGAVRFSRNNDTMIDVSRKLSDAQKDVLARVSKGNVYVDINNPKIPHLNGGSFSNFGEAYRKVLRLGPKEIKKESTNLAEKAIKQLGTTRNPDEAGFILRDGRMLDLSGKRDGGPPGVRYLDHREVSGIVQARSTKAKAKDISEALRRFQIDRKRSASRLHEITSLKSDLKKIESWNDPDAGTIRTQMLDRLNQLITARKARKRK